MKRNLFVLLIQLILLSCAGEKTNVLKASDSVGMTLPTIENPSKISDLKTNIHHGIAYAEVPTSSSPKPSEAEIIKRLGPPQYTYLLSDGSKLMRYMWGHSISTGGWWRFDPNPNVNVYYPPELKIDQLVLYEFRVDKAGTAMSGKRKDWNLGYKWGSWVDLF